MIHLVKTQRGNFTSINTHKKQKKEEVVHDLNINFNYGTTGVHTC